VELIHSAAAGLILKARRPVAAFAAAGLLLFNAPHAFAQDADADACPTEGASTIRFASAVSGDAFRTADGEEVRVAGVLAPGSDGVDSSAATIAASRAALVRAIGDRPLLLAFTGQERDRYGRLIAQLFVGDQWLQGILLAAGWVRAAPDIATESCALALLEAEAQARSTDQGLWADGRFSVLRTEQLIANERRLAGSFQIVEGTIVEVGDFRGRYFPVLWRKRHWT
jgi:endonuclease YncB( thermonuclease family)